MLQAERKIAELQEALRLQEMKAKLDTLERERQVLDEQLKRSHELSMEREKTSQILWSFMEVLTACRLVLRSRRFESPVCACCLHGCVQA